MLKKKNDLLFAGILVAGFSTFMPKFIEYEFGLSAGTAALYVGKWG